MMICPVSELDRRDTLGPDDRAKGLRFRVPADCHTSSLVRGNAKRPERPGCSGGAPAFLYAV